jgi:bacterioferritin
MGQMTQKICNLDKEKLLGILNAAYAEEWLAYYQYWVGAQVIEGPMRNSIQAEFEEHAKEELGHAKKLATRIVQLGGTPLLDPEEWKKKAHCKYAAPTDACAVTLLRQNIDAERCAIQRYQEICDLTFGKDHETYHMAREILSEEIIHEQEFEDYLGDVQIAGIDQCSIKK